MKKITVIFAVIAMLVGCTAPAKFTSQETLHYDKDTRYVIEDVSDGFILSVNYSRYQFIPESESVARACKSQLTSIAWERSDQTGRKIKPVNEQRIKISMGRNGLTGITSCHAQVKVEWE